MSAQLSESTQSTMRALLEAGVHFGHQVKRWNPKMRPFIFGERNGIHIIDLAQTASMLAEAQQFLSDIAARNGKILFVGTKKQAQTIIADEATRCGMFYVNRRWLGGTLTNFVTFRSRLQYLRNLETDFHSGAFDMLAKAEAIGREQELEKLLRTLGGLKGLTQRPAAVVIIDPKREQLAIKEANRLGIPIVALVDTNADPDPIKYVIPGNDDAIRALKLILSSLTDAIIEGATRNEIARADAADERTAASYGYEDAPAAGAGAGARGGDRGQQRGGQRRN